uniref:Uncharacterized protein n=1 Tax=Phaeomonas parva TaxID=124430 RepID=A0A6U4K9P2_9STRA|mmetsp:Transcript_43860/g.137819  ORF Transcript_43860/g.137819 Transcript_43860/m.137819 type:complete len:116 (+) Transcript_43860:585-932(+)
MSPDLGHQLEDSYEWDEEEVPVHLYCTDKRLKERKREDITTVVKRNMRRHIAFLAVFVMVFVVNLAYAAINALGSEPSQSMCMASSLNNALIGVYVAMILWPSGEVHELWQELVN